MIDEISLLRAELERAREEVRRLENSLDKAIRSAARVAASAPRPIGRLGHVVPGCLTDRIVRFLAANAGASSPDVVQALGEQARRQTVFVTISELKRRGLVDGNRNDGYRLTPRGAAQTST